MAARPDEPRQGTGGSRRGLPRSGVQRGAGGDDGRQGGARGSDGRQGGTRGGDSSRGGDHPGGGRQSEISRARAYTPRARTVREASDLITGRSSATSATRADGGRRTPRSGRSADPFRPVLQVLDGGRTAAPRGARRVTSTGGARAGDPLARTRTPRTADVAKPAPRRRPGSGGRSGNGRRTARRPSGPARPPELADPRRRLRLGTVLALAMFVAIGVRLVAIQVVQEPAYADGGLQDRLRTVVLPAPRGTIYDRSGEALAHSVEARYVYVDPTRVKDPQAVAAALSPLLGMSRSDLLKRMAPTKLPNGNPSEFEYLARSVEVETAEKIKALGLAGIGVHRDDRREVPGGDLAANLIGFVGDEGIGLEGLEARYDDVLRGVNGERVFEVGRGDLAAEIPGGYNRVKLAQPGSSLVLTIDRDLQYQVQHTLSELMRARHAKTAAAVVFDVHTGEVLAQASYPTYDAADPFNSKPTDRRDAASSFVVDPGSVHKAIVFGAALQEGVIKPDSTVVIGPSIRKGDTVFRDTHVVPAGTRISLPGILAFSSNVGTIKIADRLGPERLYEYQRKFGLGQATGEGLPGEAPGRLLKPDEWSGSSYGSVPIGHSVDATPLQMAAAYAAIANNGTWVQPRLVREIVAPDGTRTPTPAPRTRKVISPANAAALRQMLEAVTTVKHATGLKAAIPGYRVAGKTGTGARLVNGKYVAGEVASFIGMAPAENPRYVVAVFAHTPAGNGGDVTAPAFKKMMTFTLTHFRVPPTGTKPPNFVIFPS